MKHSAALFTRFALSATALAGSSLSAQEPAQRLWPEASYTLMDVRGDGDAEALARRAVAASPPDTKAPLLQGWMFSNLFAQIHADHHVYYRIYGEGAGQQVCRVTVSGLPETSVTPTLKAFGRGEKLWCHEPGRAAVVPTISAQRAAWPRGRLVRTAQFASPDGVPLTVRHIVANKRWIWPLPPQNLADVKLLTFLPQSRASSMNTKRQLFLLQLGNGRWALSFRTSREIGYDISACFIQSVRPGAQMPQENWLTTAIESWCRTQSDAHLAALPAADKPVVPPVPPPPPARTTPGAVGH